MAGSFPSSKSQLPHHLLRDLPAMSTRVSPVFSHNGTLVVQHSLPPAVILGVHFCDCGPFSGRKVNSGSTTPLGFLRFPALHTRTPALGGTA